MTLRASTSRMSLMLAERRAPAIVHMSAYANVLTRLFPDLYSGLDVVSRELLGFIPSVSRNVSAERAAVGQSIVWEVSPSLVAFDIAPAMQVPEPPDLSIGNNTMTISKARAVPFGFTGEEQKGLNTGVGYRSVQADLFAQGLRTLVNELERDLAITAAAGASRAWGTPGTTPFAGANLVDLAQVKKILDDNGAPDTDRSVILNTSAGANMRAIPNLTRVNEAGTSMTLRDGALLDLFNMHIKESAGVQNITAGTETGATTNAAGYAVGATVITLAAAGTGTFVSGDVIQFAGDVNKYVLAVGGGNASVAAGGTVTLQAPGLRVAIPAAATAITRGASYAANVAFSPNAIAFAARAPALPTEGDLRIDSMLITDPRSGMTYEVSIWPGYRKVRAEVSLAWGFKAIKPEHISLLQG